MRLLSPTLVLFLVPYIMGMRMERGLMQDAERLWDNINHGIDRLQAQARNDFQRLRPWAQRLEAEIKPAMETVEQTLGHAFDQVSRNPLFGYPNVDRTDNTPVVEQDHHQAEESRPSSGPSLHEMLLSQLGGNQGGPLNPFSIFGLSRRKNWWEGENVCVDKKVVEDQEESKDDESEEDQQGEGGGGLAFHHMIDMTMTSCRDGVNFHECTTHYNQNGKKKTVVTKYQCCYGHQRSEGQIGCQEMVMNPIDRTMNDLDGEEFMALLDDEGLLDLLAGNVTVFMPTNEAVEDFRHDLEQLNTVEQVSYSVDDGLLAKRKKRSELTVVETPQIKDILTNHIVDGYFDSSQLHDEMVLETKNPESKLRMTVYNTYPKKTIMANCARVTSRDNFATGGLVHTVDKVILPATKTIADIIASDVQFNTLANVLRKTNLLDSLSKDGQFTLFAPSDKAIANLDKDTRDKLLAGNGCSQDIINHHILPNVICSGVVESKAKTVNALKKFVMIERDDNDNLFIEGKKITIRDIVGTNGVIHVVDEVIIPDSARTIEEALLQRGSDRFLDLFQLADLTDTIDNHTIFVPSDAALETLPDDFMSSLETDKQKLQEFLLYHVAKPKTCKCDFKNNKLLESGLQDKKLRINTYGRSPLSLLDINPGQVSTVQCARMTRLDDEMCGGMIHTVDKVLLPPTGNVVEILKSHGNFNKFIELIQFAEIEDELVNAGSAITVLAPTDQAFERMKNKPKKKAFGDREVAARLVHHHLLPDVVCCSGISRSLPFFDLSGHRTKNGDVISLRRSRGGHIYAERSEVTTCDMVADNGVVHGLDRVMIPDDLDADFDFQSSEEVTRRKSPFYMFKIFK